MAWIAALCPALLLVSVDVAYAQAARFRVEGERLFYNTAIPYPDDPSTSITMRDAEEMALYLMEAPEVSIVVLESNGGVSEAAIQMGEKITRLGLATEVRNSCDSACPLIFLGGYPRTLATGGILGFHRGYVTAIGIKDSAESQNEQRTDEFNAVEDAYDRAITDTLKDLGYMVRYGVNEEFVLEMLTIPPNEIWRPSRAELVAAGVLHAD